MLNVSLLLEEGTSFTDHIPVRVSAQRCKLDRDCFDGNLCTRDSCIGKQAATTVKDAQYESIVASNSEHWLLSQRASECERFLRQHFEQRARAGRPIHLPPELHTQRQRNAPSISSLHVAPREGILVTRIYVIERTLSHDFFAVRNLPWLPAAIGRSRGKC